MVQMDARQQYATPVSSKGVAIPKGMHKGIDSGKVFEQTRVLTNRIRLTKYEVATIVVSCFICAILIILRMQVSSHHLEMEQAMDAYSTQTHNVQTQTAIMETEINMKRNYETIQQTAKENGMTINRANVKEVSNGTGN